MLLFLKNLFVVSMHLGLEEGYLSEWPYQPGGMRILCVSGWEWGV